MQPRQHSGAVDSHAAPLGSEQPGAPRGNYDDSSSRTNTTTSASDSGGGAGVQQRRGNASSTHRATATATAPLHAKFHVLGGGGACSETDNKNEEEEHQEAEEDMTRGSDDCDSEEFAKELAFLAQISSGSGSSGGSGSRDSPLADNGVGSGGAVSNTTVTTTTTTTRQRRGQREPSELHSSDYALLAETLREAGNPLLRASHDPTLATTDAGLGAPMDVEGRIDALLDGGAGDFVNTADWAERRSRRHRPAPPLESTTAAAAAATQDGADARPFLRPQRRGHESENQNEEEGGEGQRGEGGGPAVKEALLGSGLVVAEPSPCDLPGCGGGVTETAISVSDGDDENEERKVVASASPGKPPLAAIKEEEEGKSPDSISSPTGPSQGRRLRLVRNKPDAILTTIPTTAAVTMAAVGVCASASEAPPRKVLRLTRPHASASGRRLDELGDGVAVGGVTATTAGGIGVASSTTAFSPKAERPPPIAAPSNSGGGANPLSIPQVGASSTAASSPYSPTARRGDGGTVASNANTTAGATVTTPADQHGPVLTGSGGSPASGRMGGGSGGSPLSPRRAGERTSAFAAARHRLRSATPTPTPGSTYGLSDATPTRLHSAAKVPLPLSAPAVDFSSVGQWVEDRYKLTRKISEGTYGEVYVGRCAATGEVVALKRLKTLRGLDGFPITSLREVIALQHINRQRRRLTAQLLREQQRLSGGVLGHLAPLPVVRDPLEEIIDLRGVLLSRDATHDIFLVFNYASSSMAGLMARRFPFTLPDVAYIFRKITLGVRKLHDMGIIHRDIKTDNVLVAHDGGVQLADFGLCVFEGSGTRAMTPSMINLSYRPPEMLLGGTRYDTMVDVWSIGCFLAQVFLSHPPFYRRRSGDEQAQAARNNRSAETELEQLSVIAEVLGPVTAAPADAFPAEACTHLGELRSLQEALLGPGSNNGGGGHRLDRLRTLFEPSFVFSQYHGFRHWFAAETNSRWMQHSGGSGGGAVPWSSAPRPPPLRPSPACIDVLESIFQYDPRRRPSAAALLQMPFFQLLDSDPARAVYGGSSGSGPEALRAREDAARARLAASLRDVPDSHLQPPPPPAASAPAPK